MKVSHVLLDRVERVLYVWDIIHVVKDDAMARNNVVNGALPMDGNSSDAVAQYDELFGW